MSYVSSLKSRLQSQLSSLKFQVPGPRSQSPRLRSQVTGFPGLPSCRSQVPCLRSTSQISGLQDSDRRFQISRRSLEVSGLKFPGPRAKIVPGLRSKDPGPRFQVTDHSPRPTLQVIALKSQVSGVRCQVSSPRFSGLRLQVIRHKSLDLDPRSQVSGPIPQALSLRSQVSGPVSVPRSKFQGPSS